MSEATPNAAATDGPAGPGRGPVGPATVAAAEVGAGRFAGVAWRVARDGAVVDAGLEGHADIERTRPLAADDVYRIYSMTKPVVSVAALQLVEEGRLSLADPVSRWLPGFARARVLRPDGTLERAARAPRVEDLLTHRGGFSYDFIPGCPVGTLCREAELVADGGRTLGELVDVLATLPLAHEPGARWHYGYATDVLGRIVELVDGRPLGEALHERLFAPLGMTDTAFGVPEAERHRLLPMHGARGLDEVAVDVDESAQRLAPLDVDRGYPADAAGRFARGGIGLFSTLDDYARLLDVLMDGGAAGGPRLLSGPMLELAWTNRLPRGQRPIRVGAKAFPGYGWGLTGRVMVDPGEALHLTSPGEGGWAGAASTWFWVDRARRFSGLVLAQYLGSAAPLGQRVQAAAYAGLAD